MRMGKELWIFHEWPISERVRFFLLRPYLMIDVLTKTNNVDNWAHMSKVCTLDYAAAAAPSCTAVLSLALGGSQSLFRSLLKS